MGGTGPSKQIRDWQYSGNYFHYGKQKIFYKDDQNPKSQTSETLVCLHGWPTCSYDYRKVWRAFTRKFRRVIAIDYIGMGFSSKPTDYRYTFADHADYIEVLLASIGVREFHIASRALSNATSGELLRRFELRQQSPNDSPIQGLRIRSISFTNGYVFPEVYSPPGGHEGTSILTSECGPCAAKILPYGIFKPLLSRIYGPKTKPTERELQDYWYAMNYNNGRQAQPRFLAFVDEWLENGHIWVEVYKHTSVPFQDIHGPAGPVIRIQEFEPLWRQNFPRARLDILEGHVGHFVQTEDPDGYLAAYFSFVDSVLGIEKSPGPGQELFGYPGQNHSDKAHKEQIYAGQDHKTKAHQAQIYAGQDHKTKAHQAQIYAGQDHKTKAHQDQNHSSPTHHAQTHKNEVYQARAHQGQANSSQADQSQIFLSQAHQTQAHSTQAHSAQTILSHQGQTHSGQSNHDQVLYVHSHPTKPNSVPVNQAHSHVIKAHSAQGHSNQAYLVQSHPTKTYSVSASQTHSEQGHYSVQSYPTKAYSHQGQSAKAFSVSGHRVGSYAHKSRRVRYGGSKADPIPVYPARSRLAKADPPKAYRSKNYSTQAFQGHPTQTYPTHTLPNQGQPTQELPSPAHPTQNYSSQGLSTQSYPNQGFQNQTYSTQGLQNQTYSTQGLQNQTYSTQGLQNQTYLNQGLQNQTYSTQGLQNQTYSTQGLQNQTYATQGQPPQAYSTQTFPQTGNLPSRKLDLESAYHL